MSDGGAVPPDETPDGWGAPPPVPNPPPTYGQPPGYGQPPTYNQPPSYGQPPGYGQPPSYGQQPPYGWWGPPAPFAKPPNYLVWSILATLLCCLPFGVVSIVFATQVDSKWTIGDWHGALEASKRAKTWLIASVAVALVMLAAYFLFFVLIIVLASRTGTSTGGR